MICGELQGPQSLHLCVIACVQEVRTHIEKALVEESRRLRFRHGDCPSGKRLQDVVLVHVTRMEPNRLRDQLSDAVSRGERCFVLRFDFVIC